MKKNCALILAAGFSKRYGKDKRFSGSPPLIVQTISAIQLVYKDIFLVHRADDKAFLNLVKRFPLHCIPAPKEEISLGTSISNAIVSIEALKYYDTCSIFLADMPYISQKSMETLISFSGTHKIIRPQYQELLGHPVIFGKHFFSDLKALKGRNGANSVIQKNLEALHLVQIQDAGTTIDIDYPDDKKGVDK